VNVPEPRFGPPAVTAPPPLVAPPPSPLAPPLAAAPLATVPLASGVPAVELDLTGPAQVSAGDVVKYVAIIKNNGTAASQPATLEFSWDQQLSPLEASDGYQLAGAKVSWAIPAIEPKGAQERQINLRAEATPGMFRDSPPTRACVRAVLSGLAGGSLLADDSCVGIASTVSRPRVRSPSEAGLRLTLADLDDPVRSGDATTLVCTISNGGTLPTGPLDVVVLLPEGARMVGDPIPSRVRVESSRVNFGSVASIPPGGRQAFEVSYRLPGSGTGKASALVTGTELEGSLERICQTTFLEP
jgi:hypothetical protein